MGKLWNMIYYVIMLHLIGEMTGFGMAENYQEYSYFFVEALSKAFTNRELEVMLLVCEGNYCGAIGYLHGDFTGEFLGEQPSNTRTKLRFGLHWHIDTEKNE